MLRHVSVVFVLWLGLAMAFGQSSVSTSSPVQTETDEYTRYELLAPETSSLAIHYEVTAITPGAKYYYNPIRKATKPMTGLDTNILVRYLTQDDRVQSAKATEILERRLSLKNPGFVSVIALVETVWVLDRAYGLNAQEIAAAIERLLQVEVLAIQNEQEVFTAMVALRQGRGSFADALIAELGAQAACTRMLTFDQKAIRLSRFELV